MSLREGILQILLLIKILLVASILGPHIFGVFGLALLIVILIEQFSQTGIDYALIHLQNKQEYYDTAWTLKFIRGIVLFSIIMGLLDIIIELFDLQGYRIVLIVVASTLLFESLINIGTVEFRKDLNYRNEFFFRALPDLGNVFMTILFAFLLTNIWALVIGLITERFIRLILSYSLHSYRPSFSIKKDQFSELFQYGKWIFFMGVLGFLTLQGPDLFVGLVLGATFVALYQLGYKLATMPVTSLSGLIATVSIPTYAKLQDNPSSSRRAFHLTLYGQVIVYVIYSVILFPIAESFISIILGTEWLDMVNVFRVLLIGGILKIVMSNIEHVFFANGNHKLLVRWQAVGIGLFTLFVIPVIKFFGLLGIAWFLILSFLIISVGYSYEISTMLDLNYTQIIINCLQIFMIGLIVLLLLSFLQNVIIIHNIVVLTFFIIVGLSVFMLIILLLNQFFTLGFLEVFVSFFKKSSDIYSI